MKYALIVLLLIFTVPLLAQDKDQIEPGKLYHAGEMIESPKYGFKGKVPKGWSGMLPQGTEIFMLMKEDGTSGRVNILARANSDQATLEEAWKTGWTFYDNIHLNATEIIQEENLMYSEIEFSGEKVKMPDQGLLIGRCSEFGPCVTLVMITPKAYFEEVKAEMITLMEESTFVEPHAANPYLNFDWKRFLSNKSLVTFAMKEGGKKQNKIDLCIDGTFHSNVKNSGWFKQSGQVYKGNNTGNWSVSKNGQSTILTLDFKNEKLADLEIQMHIEDEKVYANEEQYYAGYSQRCR